MSEKSIQNAQKMYGSYSIGRSSESNKRIKMDSLLSRTLMRVRGTDPMVYDIGCGAGYFLDFCHREGIKKDRLYGVDLAQENVARIRAEGYDGEQGDVLKLKLSNNVSDFTISQGVIHHTPDANLAFSELVRITRPGGRIYINLYYFWNPYYVLIHSLTFPLRYLYWDLGLKWVPVFCFYLTAPFVLLLGFLSFGHVLKKNQIMSIMMDQIFTPIATTFSKRDYKNWALKHGLKIEEIALNRFKLMIAGVFYKSP